MNRTIAVDLRLPLERFDLAVRFESDCRTLGVFGRSGAGKTSLLEAMIGLRSGAVGTIRVGSEVWLDSSAGIDRPPERRHVGYVPQGALAFPHLSTRANVRLGERRSRARGIDPSPTFARCVDVLELGPLLDQPASTLSGGERQRVALARALCSAPDVLVLDEPLASLDLALRMRVLPHLRRVRDEFGVPMIVVSHAPFELEALADHLIALEAGSVVDSGIPSEVLARAFVEGRVGDEPLRNVVAVDRIRRVAGRVSACVVATDVALVVRDAGERSGAAGFVTIAADAILLARDAPQAISASNVVPGRVVRVDRGDERTVVHLAVAESVEPLLVEVVSSTVDRIGVVVGASFHAVFKASSCELTT